MLIILYPDDINWFHETIAFDLHEDLKAFGVDSRLATADVFLNMPCDEAQTDVLIINLHEIAHSLGGPMMTTENCRQAVASIHERLRKFRTRALLNVDAFSTHWFHSQFDVANGTLTHLLDYGMTAQTQAARVAGCPYIWIPECFTKVQREQLRPERGERPIPWAVIGHHTLERSVVVNKLTSQISSRGLVFLSGLRPSYKDGSRNISPMALGRLLDRTNFYVWSSHHQFPYHEGCRALLALQHGAIPAKIDPSFACTFREIPWVYESVEQFAAAIRREGADALYKKALDYALTRRCMGEYIIESLYGNSGKRADRIEDFTRGTQLKYPINQPIKPAMKISG